MTTGQDMSESWRTATLGNKMTSCYIISTEVKLTLMNWRGMLHKNKVMLS